MQDKFHHGGEKEHRKYLKPEPVKIEGKTIWEKFKNYIKKMLFPETTKRNLYGKNQ